MVERRELLAPQLTRGVHWQSPSYQHTACLLSRMLEGSDMLQGWQGGFSYTHRALPLVAAGGSVHAAGEAVCVDRHPISLAAYRHIYKYTDDKEKQQAQVSEASRRHLGCNKQHMHVVLAQRCCCPGRATYQVWPERVKNTPHFSRLNAQGASYSQCKIRTQSQTAVALRGTSW
jgi:hypothetical protein